MRAQSFPHISTISYHEKKNRWQKILFTLPQISLLHHQHSRVTYEHIKINKITSIWYIESRYLFLFYSFFLLFEHKAKLHAERGWEFLSEINSDVKLCKFKLLVNDDKISLIAKCQILVLLLLLQDKANEQVRWQT
jgi:hypothetical protein